MKETKLLKHLTILYVEDDEIISQKMTKTLHYFVNNVITVSSAEEAKKIFDKKLVDIIITDIKLQQESGIDLIRYIREKNKKIPILILSGYSDKEYLFEAIKLNLVDYLVKPVTLDLLMNNLSKALEIILDNNTINVELKNGIVYNIKEKTLFDGTKEIKLTQSEEKLLELFIEHSNDFMSKEIIKFHLWNQIDISDSAFKSALNKLRNKIGKESLLNMSKVGYKLNLKNTTF